MRLLILLTCFVSLGFGQANWKKINPEKASERFVKDFNKMDQDEFLDKYCVKLSDIKFFLAFIQNAKGVKPEKKERIIKNFTEEDNFKRKVERAQEEVRESYTYLKEHLSNPQYVDCYYEIELEEERAAHEIELYIMIKDNGQFYLIKFDDGFFYDNNWKTKDEFRLYHADEYGDRGSKVRQEERLYSEDIIAPVESTEEAVPAEMEVPLEEETSH